ncbi:MAG: hypothetical protein K940chlam7_01086 [Chlamydiae bacterium]|nr:hypothetical protein [Chlamydiota bacterium]
MNSWIQKTWNANRQTKLFVITLLLFLLPIILSAIYVYVRLDYVRSYTRPSSTIENKINP